MAAALDDLLRERLQPVPRHWAPSPLPLAAVLCPIVRRSGQDHVLFVARPRHLRSHAGQIAFPGGKRDGDEGPLACALRECREEIGVPADAIEPLGSLPPRPSSSGLSVHCLVGRLQPVPVVADPREVERVLYVPLADLRDETRWQERTPAPRPGHPAPPPSPHFPCGGDLLWGLTARFVRDLVELLR